VGADVEQIHMLDPAGGVVLVLCFHSSVDTDVDVLPEIALHLADLGNLQVHVERFVRLGLAVLEALDFLVGGGRVQFGVDAELVAFFEEERVERKAGETDSLRVWVFCPIRHAN